MRQRLRNDIQREFSKYDSIDNVQHDVHPEVNIRYNTLNIFLGQRGSGKSFNGFNEVAAISRIKSKYHLFIYVSNNPNDVTYTKFKSFITIPHVQISYDEAEDYINELREYKLAYDEIKQHHIEDSITDECRDDILKYLHINDFTQPSLHTLIMYDDAMEVFKKPSSKLYRWLLENRHFKATFIMCIQDWKGISPALKANIDSVWLFGGYPRNRYTYIYNQLSSPIDRDVLWSIYQQLCKRDVLIINHKANGTSMKIMYEDGTTTQLIHPNGLN